MHFRGYYPTSNVEFNEPSRFIKKGNVFFIDYIPINNNTHEC